MCMIKEVWKDIPEYEGLYQISNYGYVRSFDRVTNCKNNSNQIRKGKKLNIDNSTISKVCRYKKKTCGGYIWRYK